MSPNQDTACQGGWYFWLFKTSLSSKTNKHISDEMKLFPFILSALSIFTASANSPFISKVFDFHPAPGQFVNEIPKIPSDATKEEVKDIVLEQIGGDRNPGMISLGAYGGYVIFSFDHPVVNVKGEYDFKIYGNSFVSDLNSGGGSCEPGIIMVSEDVNGNGLPDDPWYEIAGSEHNNPSTFKGFRITYHKPSADHEAVPDEKNPAITDKEYIRFTTNQTGYETGYVQRNSFHSQSYWPEWLGMDTLEFEGTRLPDNGENQGKDGTEYWVLKFFEWGYADNLPNAKDPGIKIEWAVDSTGNPKHLDKVDFIKVYCAESQSCGWLGETSTEVCGAEDLHPDAVYYDGVESIRTDKEVLFVITASRNAVCIRTSLEATPFEIYSTSGMKITGGMLHSGDNRIATDGLSRGIYVLRTAGRSLKFTI